MGDGRGRIDRTEALEAHLHQAALRLLDIERAAPVLALDGVPAVGEPQRGRGVAAVLDELEPFGVGHAAIGELEGTDQRLEARAFIVIGEAVAVMADLENAAVE
jgi:hypothetical protein